MLSATGDEDDEDDEDDDCSEGGDVIGVTSSPSSESTGADTCSLAAFDLLLREDDMM